VDLVIVMVNKTSETHQIVLVGDISSLQTPASLDCMNQEGFVGYVVLPLFFKDQLKGVLEVFRRSPLELNPTWLDFVKILAGQVAVVIENASIVEGLRVTNVNMAQSYDATIQGWAAALEMRNLENQGHAQRVTEMALKVARTMGVEEKDLGHIWRGALLHDVGKMGIPEEILLKPGELTPEEWVIMRKHTSYAKELLSFIPFLKPALDISLYHHERWDGSGYPEGLKGEEIPLSARIFAVVDVWDVLLSERSYQPAWPREQVIEYMRLKSGSHFDPRVVDVLLRLIE
jgi:HD-GYP domain-containing protein (c-di-GMP phosphodiesterase class II)